MDNHLSELTSSELASVGRLWALILQNPAMYAALPDARKLLRNYQNEMSQRYPAPKFKPVYSPSGRGASLAIARACGDSTYAHYRDSGRRS